MAHWICEVCNTEIDGDEGTVLVFNTNPELGPVGAHPIRGTIPPAELPHMMLPSEEAWDHFEAHRKAVSIGFSVAHDACRQPGQVDEAYPIDLGRASSLEEWNGWVLHLAQKSWMGREDIVRMVALWWTHKGDYPTLA